MGRLTRLPCVSIIKTNLCDVVLAACDNVAVGALRAAYEAGLRVPDDVAVVGLDDSRGAFTTPPLTTVRVQCEQFGGKDHRHGTWHVLQTQLVHASTVRRGSQAARSGWCRSAGRKALSRRPRSGRG